MRRLRSRGTRRWSGVGQLGQPAWPITTKSQVRILPPPRCSHCQRFDSSPPIHVGRAWCRCGKPRQAGSTEHSRASRSVAQLVELRTHNAKVAGSSPAGATSAAAYCGPAHLEGTRPAPHPALKAGGRISGGDRHLYLPRNPSRAHCTGTARLRCRVWVAPPA